MIRVGIFGNGFARSVVLPALRQVEAMEVVGIASPNLERVQGTARDFGIAVAADDHRRILDECRLDLVFVVTPPHRHWDQTRDALDAGCHVVCEKPTALSSDESGRMWEAARARVDRLTLIDHELRFDPRRRRIAEWLAEGRLGEILHATYTVHSNFLRITDRPWGWWFDRAKGGGMLGAVGSHAVDSLRSLLGEVTRVRGTLHTAVSLRPDAATGEPRKVTADDQALAWLELESGVRASLSLSAVEAERVHQLTIAGTEGAVCLDEQRPLRAAFGREPLEEVAVDDDDLPPNEAMGIPDTDWARSFVRLAREIARALGSGSVQVPDAATFLDGHRNQQVLDAIRKSDEMAGWQSVE